MKTALTEKSTHILAIRHGETSWNVSGKIQGQLDIELNERGHQQAKLLAKSLSNQTFAAIYSSDLSRAHQTAQAITASPIHLNQGLRERHFGIYQSMTFQQIQQCDPEDARRWQTRDPDFTPLGNGESLRQFSDRVLETLYTLAHQHQGQTIGIVTHGGVLDIIYRAATHLDLQAPRNWSLGNTCVCSMLCTEKDIQILDWANTQHLQEQPLAPHGEPTDLEPQK